MRKIILIIVCSISSSVSAMGHDIEQWEVHDGYAMAQTDSIYSAQLHHYADSCNLYVSVASDELELPEVVNFNGQDVKVEYGGKNRWMKFLTPVTQKGNEFLLNEFKTKRVVVVDTGKEKTTYSAIGFSKAEKQIKRNCEQASIRTLNAL
ncbi:hypothetical protein LQM11_001235 [Vibrio parahaemolyticus]|nr:hypothetical protein [Vibrio parahaemolyticus]